MSKKARLWWRRETLTDEALAAERAARVARFKRTMGAVDRVLSASVTGLEIVTDPTSVPGWTDGETITLNTTGLPELVDDNGEVLDLNLAVWLGINGHEVGHSKYTPRVESPLFRMIENMRDQGMYPHLFKVFNVAEDQRQERLVIGRWRPWRTYLTAAATRLIIEQMVDRQFVDLADVMTTPVSATWPLICGRTWLPAEVRAAARQGWDEVHGKGAGDRLAILIGEYQKLTDPGYEQAQTALDLLTRVYNELINQGVSVDTMPGGCHDAHGREQGSGLDAGDMPDVGDDDNDVPTGGDDEDKDTLDKAAAQSPDDDGDDADGDGAGDGAGADADADADGGKGNAPGEDDSGSGDGGQSDGDGDGEGGEGSSDQSGAERSGTSGAKGNDTGTGSDQSAGAGGEGGDTQSGGAPTQGSGEGEGVGGEGHGGGTGSAHVPTPKLTVGDIAAHVASAVRKDLAHDEKVRKDLEDIRTSLQPRASRQSGLGAESKDPSRTGGYPRPDSHMPADPATRRMARDVSVHLRQLVDQSLPHWLRRVDSGKLNVRRFMNREVGDRFDDMFDRFQMGMQDEVSLDVSILLDTSSSMGVAADPDRALSSHGVTHPVPLTMVIHQAAKATWAIRRGVEAAEGDCTVYGFDTTGYVIAPTGRRPDPDQVLVPGFGGNTDPTEVINEVWARLPAVEAAHKVVVAVTDGQWASGGDTMRDLARMGVITIGVMLDPFRDRPARGAVNWWDTPEHDKELAKYQAQRKERDDEYVQRMGCTYTKVLADPLEMTAMFDEIVSDVMMRALVEGRAAVS